MVDRLGREMGDPSVHLMQAIVAGLILANGATRLVLEAVNLRHLKRNPSGADLMLGINLPEPDHARMVAYQSAQGRLALAEAGWDTCVLLLVLFSGLLPAGYQWLAAWSGVSSTALASFILAVILGLSVLDWPWAYYRTFRLEQQHGFNTMTPSLWWRDRMKGLLLSLLLGWPLLWGLVFLVEKAGLSWWFWGWAMVFGFQLLMAIVAPWLILPWFNRFEPLKEGTLRNRIFDLGRRVGFPMRQIQVMDGSRRSRHSNAFFTGFGRQRKVVLYDTLLDQLTEPQLEAVVAHEIGHAKLRHIPQIILVAGLGWLVGFYVVAGLVQAEWFYRTFGFPPDHPALALLLSFLLAGPVTFWIRPLFNGWSQRREFEADAYAARATSDAAPLMEALRRLNRENLSPLAPHPAYRWFYYSHPPLGERLARLAGQPL